MVQKRLLEFGKQQPQKYKLRHDNLIIGERPYVYDPASDCIVKLKAAKRVKPLHPTVNRTGSCVNAQLSGINVLLVNCRIIKNKSDGLAALL